jgi:nucleoside-diphosphate-sugar epimerase
VSQRPPILVTGGNGYLGSQLVASLLSAGSTVRTTVRSLDSESVIREAVRRGGADDARLHVVRADLMSNVGWADAMSGCDEVYHVASPTPSGEPDDPDDLILPARDGTCRVLQAAEDAGARRVVLTSSYAAVGFKVKPIPEFTEADWTDPETPGLSAYRRAKTMAELAAWDLLRGGRGSTELVVINPTLLLGPTLLTNLSMSTGLVKRLLDGTMEVVPCVRTGIVDVRDAALLHMLAMAAPDAAGKRFLAVADGPSLSLLDMARILRSEPRTGAAPTPEAEEPGQVVSPIVHNDRARVELGWSPRPAKTTIVDTAMSLIELGLLEI